MKVEPDKCSPIIIEAPSKGCGARLGGTPPKGIDLSHIDDLTEYFLTIPWDENHEISIFLSFSPMDTGRNPWVNARKVHDSNSTLVEVVLHTKAERSTDESLSSSLLANSLRIAPMIEDVHPGDPKLAYPYHKLGGKPFFHDAGSPGYDEADRLFADGYRHILQMSFPNDQDAAIGGSWPFGEMEFHLFSKTGGDHPDFLCFWA